MEKNLANNTYKFEFFNKTEDENSGSLDFLIPFIPLLGAAVILFMLGIFMNVNSFEYNLSEYVNHKKASSSITEKIVNDLNVSLNKKDWANVQYNLLILRKLDSTQTDKEVLKVLVNYSNQNFKKQPYSNEFALITSNYLISMQNDPTEDKRRIKSMNKNLDSFLVKDITDGEESFKQENVVYNSNVNEIKEKTSYLIKGLKESQLKESLVELVNKY